jgi:hypothetical protein
MQGNRNDGGERPPRSANPSPPIGHVHGLGESRALRVDLQPVQLPWLADEIDTLRDSIEEELALERARYDALTSASKEASNADAELHRRSYQLQVLGMVRDQLPLDAPAVAACVASPWDQPNDLALEIARITGPVTVIGPARGMLVLIRGAARNVADALGEALRGPQPSALGHERHGYAAHWPESIRVGPAVVNRLRDVAAAAEAFTNTYVAAVAQQSYSFDPEYDPIYSDDLW